MKNYALGSSTVTMAGLLLDTLRDQEKVLSAVKDNAVREAVLEAAFRANLSSTVAQETRPVEFGRVFRAEVFVTTADYGRQLLEAEKKAARVDELEVELDGLRYRAATLATQLSKLRTALKPFVS